MSDTRKLARKSWKQWEEKTQTSKVGVAKTEEEKHFWSAEIQTRVLSLYRLLQWIHYPYITTARFVKPQ